MWLDCKIQICLWSDSNLHFVVSGRSNSIGWPIPLPVVDCMHRELWWSCCCCRWCLDNHFPGRITTTATPSSVNGNSNIISNAHCTFECIFLMGCAPVLPWNCTTKVSVGCQWIIFMEMLFRNSNATMPIVVCFGRFTKARTKKEQRAVEALEGERGDTEPMSLWVRVRGAVQVFGGVRCGRFVLVFCLAILSPVTSSCMAIWFPVEAIKHNFRFD